MNIPEIYLVEPYNAYTTQPGGRKKHWHEVIEEQALLQRIMAEQIALQEAQTSRTLPPNSPATAQAVVGNSTGGAGGVPVVDFFHPEADIVNFSATPTTGNGPLTVKFTNSTTTQYLDTYTWNFGDGATSNDSEPTHLYANTGSYTVQLTASHQLGNPVMTSSVAYISSSKPSITAGFTFVSSSKTAPSIATFINTSVNTSQTPTTTYLWVYGSGSLTSTSATPAPITYTVAGPYTASLQATGSYGLTSLVTASWRIS
jgi:PKD repeat protein